MHPPPLSRAELCAVQERLLAAQEQYEVLKERNQTELVRLNLQRAVDFRQALSRFAQVWDAENRLRPEDHTGYNISASVATDSAVCLRSH
jgi:hypothetical protein